MRLLIGFPEPAASPSQPALFTAGFAGTGAQGLSSRQGTTRQAGSRSDLDANRDSLVHRTEPAVSCGDPSAQVGTELCKFSAKRKSETKKQCLIYRQHNKDREQQSTQTRMTKWKAEVILRNTITSAQLRPLPSGRSLDHRAWPHRTHGEGPPCLLRTSGQDGPASPVGLLPENRAFPQSRAAASGQSVTAGRQTAWFSAVFPHDAVSSLARANQVKGDAARPRSLPLSRIWRLLPRRQGYTTYMPVPRSLQPSLDACPGLTPHGANGTLAAPLPCLTDTSHLKGAGAGLRLQSKVRELSCFSPSLQFLPTCPLGQSVSNSQWL